MLHVVTDSCALYTNWPALSETALTVVPNSIQLSGQNLREGVDRSLEETMRLLGQEGEAVHLLSPDTDQFAQVYSQLALYSSGIISIHPSRKLYPSWENARKAARHIGGHCPIEVIDSQSVSAGQAMLVDVAFRAIRDGLTFDEVVRKVRGAADRVFSVFYVESVDALLQSKVLSSSHAILGSMLGIKPFLAIEEGMLRTIEKVSTRTQAVERLVEYVVEFTDIDDMIILQSRLLATDQTRMIQDRLALEFGGRHVSTALYGPALAVLLGFDATGVFVLESEMENLNGDFF